MTAAQNWSNFCEKNTAAKSTQILQIILIFFKKKKKIQNLVKIRGDNKSYGLPNLISYILLKSVKYQNKKKHHGMK